LLIFDHKSEDIFHKEREAEEEEEEKEGISLNKTNKVIP